MTKRPDVIIGSGPAGVSAAVARLAKGRPVLMLDAGQQLEGPNQALKQRLRASSPADWATEDVASYKAGQFEAPEGAIRKFGSDYAVESADQILSGNHNWLGLRASNAIGGLSNVWGASVLPCADGDIVDWPISTADLSEHYQAVTAFMPVAGRRDAIEHVYPTVNMTGRSPLPFTPQAEALLARVDARDGDQGGVTVGAARNAVSGDCVRCGLCLHGCPYGHIWSAAHKVEALKSNALFSYRGGAKVAGIQEHSESVRLTLEGGQTVDAERVFVGTGVLETARLFLKSFPELDNLTLLDSQHFFTPFLHQWASPSNPKIKPHHTLSGVFAEFVPSGSDRLVHSQLYTWNEQYKREMMANYGRKIPFSAPLFEALSRRLIVAQSFLHSDFSGKIGLRIASGEDRLTAENWPNSLTDQIVKIARTQLAKGLRHLGLHALGFAGHSGAPGSSFHVGGSLGMTEHPKGAQTDILGRLQGLERVHVVDASVMTSVPASTITFTVMANAHRIGTDAP